MRGVHLLSKLCGRCKQDLPLSSFQKSTRYGWQSYCKECAKQVTAEWRRNHRAYGRKKNKEWRENNRERSREIARKSARKYLDKYGRRYQPPEVILAHRAIREGVKKGALVKPPGCSKCQREDLRIEAHHYLGYAVENHLDIQWLCASCHWYADHPTDPLERKLDGMLAVLRAKA